MAVDVPHPSFEAYARETPPQASPGAPGKEGELSLRFAPDGTGETKLVRDYARVPYHVSGTLDGDPHPDAATVHLQSPTGGVAQGDRLTGSVRVDAEGVAVVSTQSASKVLSMEYNYATERTDLAVGEGGHLDYVPKQVILHENARFAQETTVTVADSASAVVSDVVMPGRLARDEVFDFDRYYSSLAVRREGSGELLFEDTTHLDPGDADPTAPGVCGEFPVYGALYVVAPAADGDALADALHDLVGGEGARAGATTLPNGAGALVRVLAAQAEGASGALHTAWDRARAELVGAGAPEPSGY